MHCDLRRACVMECRLRLVILAGCHERVQPSADRWWREVTDYNSYPGHPTVLMPADMQCPSDEMTQDNSLDLGCGELIGQSVINCMSQGIVGMMGSSCCHGWGVRFRRVLYYTHLNSYYSHELEYLAHPTRHAPLQPQLPPGYISY